MFFSFLLHAALSCCPADTSLTQLEVVDPEQGALRGIHQVAILVENIREDGLAAGFDPDRYASDVELKLRLAGIKVIDPEQARAAGMPVLYVSVQPMKYSRGAFAVATRLELIDDAMLSRNPMAPVLAVTWHKGFVGVLGVERVDSQREVVRELADEFVTAYLAANPEPSP